MKSNRMKKNGVGKWTIDTVHKNLLLEVNEGSKTSKTIYILLVTSPKADMTKKIKEGYITDEIKNNINPSPINN